jgi:phosphoglycolate phosphatase
MTQVIFFDLDDTLIDTSHRHYMVYKDILDFHKIPNALLEEEFWSQKRTGRKTVEFLPISGEFSQEFMSEWLRKIEDRAYLKYDSLFSETLDLLSKLRKYNLVLVTLRNDKQNLFWELDQLKLTEYFTEILVGSPASKNKVALVKTYLKENSGRDNCVIVGDSEVDVYAGKEMGFLTVAFTGGVRSRNFLSKVEPDFCIDNLFEIFKILDLPVMLT